MKGTEKQISWAKDIKADLMTSIETICNDFAKRAAGNAEVMAKVEEIMAAIEAKDAAFWIDRRPMQDGKLSGGAAQKIWKEVAAEVHTNK